MTDHPHIIIKAAGAIAFNAFAVISSFQAQFEWWLRIVSLLAGIVVAGLTAASILRGMRSGK